MAGMLGDGQKQQQIIINVSDVLLILIKILDECSDRNSHTALVHKRLRNCWLSSEWDLSHITSLSNIHWPTNADVCVGKISANATLVPPLVGFQWICSLINKTC